MWSGQSTAVWSSEMSFYVLIRNKSGRPQGHTPHVLHWQKTTLQVQCVLPFPNVNPQQVFMSRASKRDLCHLLDSYEGEIKNEQNLVKEVF